MDYLKIHHMINLVAATLFYLLTGAVVYGCMYVFHKRKNLEPSAWEEGVFAEYFPVKAKIKDRLEYGFIHCSAVFICLLIWPFAVFYLLWQAWRTIAAPAYKHNSN